MAGKNTVLIPVAPGEILVPHFLPERNNKFFPAGSATPAERSGRSHATGRAPIPSRSVSSSGRLNRDSPVTRLDGFPARFRARRSIIAVVPPILPPTPRIRKSPARRRTQSTTAEVGVDSSSLIAASSLGGGCADSAMFFGFTSEANLPGRNSGPQLQNHSIA